MKFKAKDIVYVVHRCDLIAKEKISCYSGSFYAMQDGCYVQEEDTFKKLSEAKVYARELLDKYNLKVSKYIDNIRPKLEK